MNPKQKATDLVNLYCQVLMIRSYEDKSKAKICASIVVDEMIVEILKIDPTETEPFVKNWGKYWLKVKEEINGLSD